MLLPDTPIVLVGTKIDLRNEINSTKFVSKEEGEKMANLLGAQFYFEISSLQNFGLKQIFEYSAKLKFHDHNQSKKISVNKTVSKNHCFIC